eukprot:UN10183
MIMLTVIGQARLHNANQGRIYRPSNAVVRC